MTLAGVTPERLEATQRVEREVLHIMRRVKRVAVARAAEVHPELGTTSYFMLGWLAEQGSVRSSDLVDAFGIDKGAVSRQVAHFEQLGFITRSPDPEDGRASRLSLSEEGQQRLRRLAADRHAWLGERLGDWDDADLARLGELLERFRADITE